MEPVVAKVISLCILGVVTTLTGLLPLKLKFRKKNAGSQVILNALLAFSGGVLFATCFVHLIPEANEAFTANIESSTKNGSLKSLLPWGEIVICCGFFIIYITEEVVEYFVCRSCEKQHHHHRDQDDHHHHHNDHQDSENVGTHVYTPGMNPLKHGFNDAKRLGMECFSPIHSTHGTHRESHDARDCPERDKGGQMEDQNEDTPLLLSKQTNGVDVVGSHDDLHSKYFFNVFRGLLLVCALSFHSIFEGMAIGLQLTTKDVWNSFLGVALHKFVLAFCVGIELVSLQTKSFIFCIYIVTFSLISPLGIAIGIIFTETNLEISNSSLVVATLQAFASGTLMYVTFFEILAKTKAIQLAPFLNLTAMIVGFALLTGLHTI